MNSGILILALDQKSDEVVLILEKVGIIQKRLNKWSSRQMDERSWYDWLLIRVTQIKKQSVRYYLKAFFCRPKPGVIAKNITTNTIYFSASL